MGLNRSDNVIVLKGSNRYKTGLNISTTRQAKRLLNWLRNGHDLSTYRNWHLSHGPQVSRRLNIHTSCFNTVKKDCEQRQNRDNTC